MSVRLVRIALIAFFAAGCASSANRSPDHLAERICAPPASVVDPSRATPTGTDSCSKQGVPGSSQTITPVAATATSPLDGSAPHLEQAQVQRPRDAVGAPNSTSTPAGSVATAAQQTEQEQSEQITLAQAIETAYRSQPRLRILFGKHQ